MKIFGQQVQMNQCTDVLKNLSVSEDDTNEEKESKQRSNENIISHIQNMVYQQISHNEDIDDSQLSAIIDDCILNYYAGHIISIKDREQLQKSVFNTIRKMGILQELLEDDSITEIMINGYKNIFIEKKGHLSRWEKQFENKEELVNIAQKIAAVSNRIVNESVPIVDTRLSDGSRVNIVLPPIAMEGPVVTIRKFYDTPITIEKLVQIGSITQDAADFLKKAVKAKYNIFISGGTGSGKTTFLNALSNFVPSDERVITIEDSAELQIKNVSNLVRLEARMANVEGKNAVTIRDLIRSSLRMRPDRIIVGEVRGAEALDMLQAMNTGHSGSLSTGHSNSPKDMLTRIETMVLMGMDMPVTAIKHQIESAIDIIVHLSRLRDKSRKVMQIEEVAGFENGEIRLNTLYKYHEQGEDLDGNVIGTLVRQKNKLININKMEAAGIKKW